jgi:hypothetical protein
MAKVLCNEHGGQVAGLMCEHVARAIELGDSIQYAPSSHPDLEGIWLCVRCAGELESLTLDPEIETFLSRIRPCCGLCARAWRILHPRAVTGSGD